MKDLGISIAFAGFVLLTGMGISRLAQATSVAFAITTIGVVLLVGGVIVALAGAEGSA